MQRDSTLLAINKVIELINSHPEFNNLISSINKFREYSIWGVSEGLEEYILKAIERRTNFAYIYSLNSEIRNLNSTDYIVFNRIKNNYSFSNILSILENLGYKRTSSASKNGEYVVNGGVINIYIGEYILRLDWFGDILEKSYLIDVFTGSIEYIINNIFIPRALLPLYLSSYDLPIFDKCILVFNSAIENKSIFDFEPVPFVYENDRLFKYEIERRKNGKIIVFSKTQNIVEKIYNLNIPIKIEFYEKDFPFGFSSKSINTIVITDKELKGKLNLNINKKKKNENLLLIGDVNIDDLIVHEDHGVGIYRGVVKRQVQGLIKEYILLEYAKEDKLYIPLDQISKLTKYVGSNNSEKPPLTRLGTMDWERVKNKVKASIQEIAGELLKLYALREVVKKVPIPKETMYYSDLEKSFDYELTPDQETSIEDVLKDLESDKPMDRLIVGDVGFGKTEIAIRASFKVVENNFQVGIIAPTTILANQLYNVFKDRLSRFGFKIALLSRFEGNKNNNIVIKDLSNGKIDIVIGTHRLLQNDIKFKNLGLVVIDEEQRFGVKQKEKLKGLRIDTNILSMSATPIPRTLHMALSGARDISVINTPPKGRKSIKTVVLEKDWLKIKEIIEKEVENHGQVYFVHNRVATINNIKLKLEKLMPSIRFIEGHGKMISTNLTKVIENFRENQYDVLIASTIVENGIDIANVNSIFINDAQRFGLSQLYQLRGRVGRSNRQSYCYLVYPKNYLLEGAVKQRMNAIMNAQDLGSGFYISIKDMEIRGVGNFLGREQHGNISAIGFELYTKLLSTEISKISSK